MENYKIIWIIRGLPGSGKSSVAENLWVRDQIFEADKYFIDKEGQYNFDASKLGEAHKWCQEQVENCMKQDMEDAEGSTIISDIVVSNTFTTEKELEPYFELAKKYDYKVVSMIIENRHGKGEETNTHGVSKETIDKMENRLKTSIKLR